MPFQPMAKSTGMQKEGRGEQGPEYGATGYPFIRANGEKSQRTRESCDVSISAFHLQYRLR